MSNLKHIVEGYWDEISGNIQTNWGKLTDEDIEEINGSYKKLIGKLKQSYGLSLLQAESELAKFFESDDLKRIVDQSKSKIQEIKDIVFESLDEYYQSVKKKTAETEKAIINYAADNPIKVLSIVLSIGLVAGFLYKSKRN